MQITQCISNFATNNIINYKNVIRITTIICTVGNGCKGIYIGYILNRHKTYVDCITNTTIEFFGATCAGCFCGLMFGLASPILFPLFCIITPIACGVGIVKYFDKNACGIHAYSEERRRSSDEYAK